MFAQLVIKYVDKDEAATTRTIVPFAVVHADKGVYVHAFCMLRKARRTFKLDNIEIVDVQPVADDFRARCLKTANAHIKIVGKGTVQYAR